MVGTALMKVSLKTSAALAGAFIIGAYVIFGAPTVSRKKRRKRDDIPGLSNIGNSCFLNALVQGLASCPQFLAWLSTKHTSTAPPLVRALHSLLRVLNNEGGGTGDGCAGQVLGALRAHGWVISPEEQDTHELFHVLTSTIEDELTHASTVPSLLDVSWLDHCRRISAGHTDEDLPAVECADSMENRAQESNKILPEVCENGTDGGGDCEETVASIITRTVLNTKKSLQLLSDKKSLKQKLLKKKSCSDLNNTGSKKDISCMFSSHENLHQSCDKTAQNSSSSRTLTEVKGSDEVLETQCKQGEDAHLSHPGGDVQNLAVTASLGCDGNENHKKPRCLVRSESQPTKAGRDAKVKRLGSEQADIPFRGYLASQLQCTVCLHKNAAQWTSFESLSLSLSSLPLGEVSLQELLASYITQERVTDVSCEECSQKTGAPVKTSFIKQLTIGKLPECLCFHIKRTVWLENGSAIKRRDHVTFPEFFIMDPYTYTTSITSQGTSGSGVQCEDSATSDLCKLLQECYQKPATPTSVLSQHASTSCHQPSALVRVTRAQYDHLYRLKAVIVHVGDVFCGHFVTYRRGPLGSRTRNRWFYTSDLLVREASLEEVRKANAYMILYEKIT